jgi:uncharacterized coiled-coil DUF342 family protein
MREVRSLNQEEKEQFQELGEAWEDMKEKGESIHPKYVDWLIEILMKQEKENECYEKALDDINSIAKFMREDLVPFEIRKTIKELKII